MAGFSTDHVRVLSGSCGDRKAQTRAAIARCVLARASSRKHQSVRFQVLRPLDVGVHGFSVTAGRGSNESGGDLGNGSRGMGSGGAWARRAISGNRSLPVDLPGNRQGRRSSTVGIRSMLRTVSGNLQAGRNHAGAVETSSARR